MAQILLTCYDHSSPILQTIISENSVTIYTSQGLCHKLPYQK